MKVISNRFPAKAAERKNRDALKSFREKQAPIAAFGNSFFEKFPMQPACRSGSNHNTQHISIKLN